MELKPLKSLLFIFAISIVFTACFSRNDGGKAGSSHEHDHQQTVYTCPMHPDVTSNDAEAACPICGMDLVPIEEGSSDSTPADRASVSLKDRAQQMIGVKTQSLQKRKIMKTIRAPGRVAFDPKLYTAKTEYLEAKKQWQRVKDSPLQEVKRSTQEMLKSSRTRLRVLGLSDDQIQKIDRGGEGARRDDSLILGGEGGPLQVYADLFESDLAYVEAGLKARVQPAAGSSQVIDGEVIGIDRLIDSKTRTARVRVQVDSKGTDLRPESYVTTLIESPLGEHLAVPNSAIVNTGRRKIVYVKNGDGNFLPQEVLVTMVGDQYSSVSGELSEQDQVVVQGHFMLDSEARLNASRSGR